MPEGDGEHYYRVNSVSFTAGAATIDFDDATALDPATELAPSNPYYPPGNDPDRKSWPGFQSGSFKTERTS
jgi:hypothetical protein